MKKPTTGKLIFALYLVLLFFAAALGTESFKLACFLVYLQNSPDASVYIFYTFIQGEEKRKDFSRKELETFSFKFFLLAVPIIMLFLFSFLEVDKFIAIDGNFIWIARAAEVLLVFIFIFFGVSIRKKIKKIDSEKKEILDSFK